MKKFLSVLLAATMIPTLLTGCGGSADTQNNETQKETEVVKPAEEAKPAGEKNLRVSLYTYPTDLEPTNGYYGWGLTRMGIGETLVKFDKDLNMVPWLAESWEQKDDETWVFHIREGVKFHNGNPMTAQHCMETIQRSMDMNTRAANIANIKSMSVDGMDLTIDRKSVV